MKVIFIALFLLASAFTAQGAPHQRTDQKQPAFAVRYVLLRFDPKIVTYNKVARAMNRLRKSLDLSNPKLTGRKLHALIDGEEPETVMSVTMNASPGIPVQSQKSFRLRDLNEKISLTLALILKESSKKIILKIKTKMLTGITSNTSSSEIPINGSAVSLLQDYQYSAKNHKVFMVALLQVTRR